MTPEQPSQSARGGLSGGGVIIALVAAFGLLSLAIIYGWKLNYPPIRSDGVGYYLYLPAGLIDRDLTLQTTTDRSFGGRSPEWGGVNQVPGTNRQFIKYPMGVAVLVAPFFLVAHALALAGAGEADGFSPVYQVASAVAGLAYLLAGLVILRRLLAKSFAPSVVAWTLIVLVFGTNLFHYGTYDGALSHAFSFFLFALFLSSVESWYGRPRLAAAVGLGVVAGLVTLVRPTNSVLFVYALLFGIGSVAALRERGRFLRRHAPMVLAGVAAYACAVSPQLVYWKVSTGSWVIFSYTDEWFRFGDPQIWNVLFSVRKGLFFWSPLLVLALAGLFFLPRYKRDHVLPAPVFLLLNLYVISSWHAWSYGGSFGHRAFVESLAPMAFGYASLLQAASTPARRRTLLVVSSLGVLLSALLMVKYWLGIIPYDRTTWSQFVSALLTW